MKKLLLCLLMIINLMSYAQRRELQTSTRIIFGYSPNILFKKFNADFTKANRYAINSISFENNEQIISSYYNNPEIITNAVNTKEKFISLNFSYGKEKVLKNFEGFQLFRVFSMGLQFNHNHYFDYDVNDLNIVNDKNNIEEFNIIINKEKNYGINFGPSIGIRKHIKYNFWLEAEAGVNFNVYLNQLNINVDNYKMVNNNLIQSNISNKDYLSYRTGISNGVSLGIGYRF